LIDDDGIETDQETRDWHRRHLEEGIRQADAGEFVDPAEMRRRIAKMLGHPNGRSDTGTDTR
jgi:predicted transcriptional regulator